MNKEGLPDTCSHNEVVSGVMLLAAFTSVVIYELASHPEWVLPTLLVMLAGSGGFGAVWISAGGVRYLLEE